MNKYTIIIILYYLFMIDLEKHAYMLQCYKCYKCYIRGISVLGIKPRNAFQKLFRPCELLEN